MIGRPGHLLLTFAIYAAAQQSPQSVESAKQDVVVEVFTTDVSFNDDGTSRQETTARFRIQSDAAVQQFGVLSFPYQADCEKIESFEIRVRKPDGAVVVTPEANAQDLAAAVARSAPTYSDAREKQIPVKALGVGDVLEYRIVQVRTKAEAPGHFWYTDDFFKDRIVLDETLRISVPAGMYVKVSSPANKPEKREENGRAIYTWKSTLAAVPKHDDDEQQPSHRPMPAVQMTTFHNWEEVGKWYAKLQQTRIELTPALRAKAAELTAGLKTDNEKARALYQFVSTKFRYISVSLGEGRYQPHSADEVLANQYGDCKDKHTLFAALLKAAGVEAWPVLIGAGLAFDSDLPSPAQFNHVITYLPGGGLVQFLDTTPEVGPYGYLDQVLRDQQVLLIPVEGAPRVVTTPAVLPYAAAETISMKAKLAGDGTLTGHFELSARGDTEVVLRELFHSTGPAQWTALIQKIAAAMGYGGTVKEVDVESPTNLEAPFRYSCNYDRKEYADWPHRRITAPVPPMTLLATDEKFKPKEPVYFGALGKITYGGSIELPDGYSAEAPGNVRLHSQVADYSATYLLDGRVLSVERVLTVKSTKLSAAQWEEYRKFADAVQEDQGVFIQLVHSTGATGRVTRDVPEAADFVRKAAQALQSRDFNTVRTALAQAERLNPEQANLWLIRAAMYEMQSQDDKALDAMRKEMQFHPGNEIVYRAKAEIERRMGHLEDAVETVRQWVKMAPEDSDAVTALSGLLAESRKSGDAVEPLRAALKNDPENLKLNLALMDALVRAGRKDEGLAAIAKLRQRTLDGSSLNTMAWALADSNVEPELARELSVQAITMIEESLGKVTLADLTDEQLLSIDSLGATWDTLGWAYFGSGELEKAERYLSASWMLLQNAGVADHLGQLRQKQGRTADAIRFYQLSLAVKHDQPDTRARLLKLGGAPDDRPTLRRGTGSAPRISPEEELSKLRTVGLPELKLKGTADFMILFTASGVEDLRFLSGDDRLKVAEPAIRKARYNMPFPDQGPEKIARRAILSCSEAAVPNCSLVLLLPGNTSVN